VFTGIIIFTLVLLILFVYIIMPRGKAAELKKTDALYNILKDGDIICRLGDRFWSQLFKDISNDDKRFSHIGIIRIYNDKITVIHAEGTTKPQKDFVKEEPLEDFLKIARAIGIYRIKDLEENLISGTAMEYIGVNFDWKFDMNDESEIYCTELLYIVLKRLIPEIELNTIYVKELGKNIIPIEAISNSDYFTELIHIDNRK